MPLYSKIDTNQARIGIWKLAETSSQLQENLDLPPGELNKLSKLQSAHRRCEFLATRALLKTMLGFVPEIHYTETGQPILPGMNINLSISHSKNLVCVILSQHQVGIDTEDIGRMTQKIASRFLSEKELKWIEKSANPQLAMLFCWCIKEAVFKVMLQHEIDFKHNIYIYPFEPHEKGVAKVCFSKNEIQIDLELYFGQIENNALVWCVTM